MSANSSAKEFRKRLGTHDADINAIVDEMLATMERLEFELEAASKRQAASYKESVEMATLAAHEIEALRKERDELKERLNYYSYTMGKYCERADDALEDRDRLRMANAELRARLADVSVPASEDFDGIVASMLAVMGEQEQRIESMRGALRLCAEVMRRSDLEEFEPEISPVTSVEWFSAIEMAERMATANAPHKPRSEAESA